MKKNVLLVIIALIGFTQINFAQLTVWSDDFDDEDISNWQLIDADSDGRNWDTGYRVVVNENDFSVSYDDSYKIIGSYVRDPETWDTYAEQDNWAISPEISLEIGGGYVYGGTIKVILNAQPAIAEGESLPELDIYGSITSPNSEDLESSFTFLGSIQMENPNDPNFGPFVPQFTEYELDISDFITDNTSFYIAIRHEHKNNSNLDPEDGFEIDEIIIEASETVLGISTVQLNGKVKLIQNPIKERLLLSNMGNLEPVQVEIYDMTGKKLMENTYSKNGLDVSNLANGLYMARITNAKAATTLKFIKQ